MGGVLTELSTGAGCWLGVQLGLRAGGPISLLVNLFTGCLGFLTAW